MIEPLKIGGNLALDEVCRTCKGECRIVGSSHVTCPDCGGVGTSLTEAGRVICRLVARHLNGTAMPPNSIALHLKEKKK